jgi:hypothetical protein
MCSSGAVCLARFDTITQTGIHKVQTGPAVVYFVSSFYSHIVKNYYYFSAMRHDVRVQYVVTVLSYEFSNSSSDCTSL